MENVYQLWKTIKRGKNMRTNNRQALQEVSKSKHWPLCISKSAIGAVSKITGQQNVNVKSQNRKMNLGFETLKHNLQRNLWALELRFLQQNHCLAHNDCTATNSIYKLVSHTGLNKCEASRTTVNFRPEEELYI